MDDDINIDEAEDLFEEFLGGYEDLDSDALKACYKILGDRVYGDKYDLKSGPLWVLTYNDERYAVEKDEDTNLYSSMTLQTWLERAMEDPEQYADSSESIEDFWDGPSPLYHATDESNLDSIFREGLHPERETRGLNNRWIGAAVFTSFDPSAIEIYGDTLLKIDTKAMKRDGYTPRVSLEPGIAEYDAGRSLLGILDVEELYPLDEPDADYQTVVVFGGIPPKYLKEVEWP